MFIVHDHREIPDILKDPRDERVELAFMRRWESGCWLISRAPQLEGSISIICNHINDTNVSKTENLLLNENVLHSIDGISLFKRSPLKLLSLSNNCLETLPDEVFTRLSFHCRFPSWQHWRDSIWTTTRCLNSLPSYSVSILSTTFSCLETACALYQVFQITFHFWRNCTWTSVRWLFLFPFSFTLGITRVDWRAAATAGVERGKQSSYDTSWGNWIAHKPGGIGDEQQPTRGNSLLYREPSSSSHSHRQFQPHIDNCGWACGCGLIIMLMNRLEGTHIAAISQ